MSVTHKSLFGREVLLINRNSTDKRPVPKRGGILRECEFAIYPKGSGVGEGSPRDKIEGHWCIPWWRDGGSLHAKLAIDDDEHRYEVSLGLGIGLFGLRWGRPRIDRRPREYSIRWHAEFIVVRLGAKPHEWSRRQPWWWENTLNLNKLVTGGHEYCDTTLERVRGYVEMPEGCYPAQVTMTLSEWRAKYRWARNLRFWPFYQSVRRAEIEPDIPIPHPGKGENSWDQDEDCMYSLTTPATDVREALQKTAESAMRDRIKYGNGYGWRPSS